MSYVSVLKSISEIITQPIGIAVLASIGIHGAIALFLPWTSWSSPEPNPAKQTKSPKTVGLLELNQTDQGRLPQTNTSQLSQQPGVSLQSQLPLQAQVPPFPKFAIQSPPLPPQVPVSSLVEPPLRPIGISSHKVSIVSLPKKSQFRIPQARNWQFQSNTNASQTTTPSIPRVNDRDVARLQDDIALGKPQPLSSINETKPQLPSNLPAMQTASIPTNLPNTPVPINSNNPVTTTGIANQEFVAPVGNTPQVGGNLAMGETNLPPWQQKPVAKTPLPTTSIATTLIRPGKVTEQQIAKVSNFNDQLRKIREQYPNVVTKKLISETVSIQRGQEGNIEGSLVFSDGKVDSIEFLDNSVPSSLKAATREYFRDYFQKNPVQANSKPQYYPFRLSFLPTSNSTSTPNAVNPSKLPVLVPQKLPSFEATKTQPSPSGGQDLIDNLRKLDQNSQSSQQQPASQPLQLRTNQPTIKLIPQTSQSQVNNSQDSSQKLLQQLRQVRNQRQTQQ